MKILMNFDDCLVSGTDYVCVRWRVQVYKVTTFERSTVGSHGLPGALDNDLEQDLDAAVAHDPASVLDMSTMASLPPSFHTLCTRPDQGLTNSDTEAMKPPVMAPPRPEGEAVLLDFKADNVPKTLREAADAECRELHHAAKHGLQDVLRALLEGQADLEAKDEHGQTSLHLAVTALHGEVVKVLLDYQANLKATDHQGRTALHLAADKPQDGDKFQLKHSQHSYSSLVSVTTMVARNWLSQRVSIGGQNSLEIIDGTAHLDVARLLLDHKAEVDAADNFGRTACHIAAENEDSQVLALLLEHGADVTLQDHDGLSPVDVCLQGRSFDIVAVFAEHGIWSRLIFMRLLQSAGFGASDLLDGPQIC
ncbi:unnamed protein product [Cladocopium goreaui]|uniref:Death-associated protein kinase 1 (DAP kinase 1) n=1 Tax=Cladocopium goreaui TaxID=2562237 RepID=A0A9P1FS00_9DINO|nr:unnamed protein product [Cladocopium goreaui]